MISKKKAIYLLSITICSILFECTSPPPQNKLIDKKTDSVKIDKRIYAHEFFLRALQHEWAGNEAVVSSYYQIASEYDPQSRDLCFLYADKLKTSRKLDTALKVAAHCLELEGITASNELQIIGEIYLRKGEMAQALVYYNKALDLDDKDRDLLYTLATLYESIKDIPKYTLVMEKLLPKIDYPAQLVDHQAHNYMVAGKLDKLPKLYTEAWEHTNNIVFGEKLAAFYEEQEMYSNLIEVYRHLEMADSDNTKYSLQKARAFELAKLPDSALVTFADLNKKHPGEKEIMSPYASLLFEKKQYAEVKDILISLIKMQPNSSGFHFLLASTAFDLKELTLAESEFKRALEIDTKVPDYWAKLAFFYIHGNRDAEAFELLEKMTKEQEKNWMSWYLRGLVFFQVAKKIEENKDSAQVTGDLRTQKITAYRESGIISYQRAINLDEKNPRVYFELGIALESVKRKAESIVVLKKLVQFDSTDPVILNYLGYLLVEQNQEAEYSLHLIDKALQLDPHNGAILDSKGWWYFQQNNFKQARIFIEQAFKTIPNDTSLLEHYALVLEKLGERDAAIEKWKMILKLDPEHELAHRKVN